MMSVFFLTYTGVSVSYIQQAAATINNRIFCSKYPVFAELAEPRRPAKGIIPKGVLRMLALLSSRLRGFQQSNNEHAKLWALSPKPYTLNPQLRVNPKF